MLNPSHNRHAEYYADKLFPSFPRDAMHPWQYNNKQFHNSLAAIRRVAAETSGVDDGVGEVMATLKRLGLDENTLVIYGSDQGWMGGQNGMWGMGDHFRPIGAHELMMQVPFIFRQPGHIPGGATSDHIVSNYDFMPSLLSYLGLGDKMPQQPKSPGRDFSATLRGEQIPWDNVMYYEMETCRAIRTDQWKCVLRYPNGPQELYDMQADPRERFNLYGEPGMDAVRAEMTRRLNDFFARYADPQYDIWKGGRSKAKRLVETAAPLGK
jgi:arylsulfatase A-like enzyme